MNGLMFVLIGTTLAVGVVLLVVALHPNYRDPELVRSRRLVARARRRLGRISKSTRVRIVVGVVAGIVAAGFSGIIVTAVIVPLGIIGLPMLLAKQDTRERELLTALEAWSRALSSATATPGLTLREVFGVTRESTPEILRVAVDRMYRRMSSSWSNSKALRAFAAEFDDVWVDEVAIYLIQAAEQSPGGLADALEGIADSLAKQVKLRMEIYLEREKPRQVLLQMAGIAILALGATVLLARTPQLSVYATPVGQVILMLVTASVAGLLLWAKTTIRFVPEARILSDEVPV